MLAAFQILLVELKRIPLSKCLRTHLAIGFLIRNKGHVTY